MLDAILQSGVSIRVDLVCVDLDQVRVHRIRGVQITRESLRKTLNFPTSLRYLDSSDPIEGRI